MPRKGQVPPQFKKHTKKAGAKSTKKSSSKPAFLKKKLGRKR